jgi:hypothetical protein
VPVTNPLKKRLRSPNNEISLCGQRNVVVVETCSKTSSS